MANENTYENQSEHEKEASVMREMLPFFIYILIPLMITLAIAWIFAPSP